MPGMNGYEFAKALKADEKWADVPVLALSAHTAPEDLERGYEAGFKSFVSKSDRDGLLTVLNEAFSNEGAAA